MTPPKVSVIIPVYRAEKYIVECVRSIFSQTLSNLEIIIIDDCSPDNSIDLVNHVLEDFPNRDSQTKIIRNECNIGVGQTRQKGIDLASGEYIIHCDPDDWVDIYLYEIMLKYAVENGMDIVTCDFLKEEKDTSKILGQCVPSSKHEMFTAIASRKLHMSLCNKLIKRELYSQFKIQPHINMWEDMSICPLMLLSADKIGHVEKTYYHYRVDNQQSIVNTVNINNVNSQVLAIKYLTDNIFKNNFNHEIDLTDLYLLHWTALLSLLLNMTDENGDIWNSTFPEQIRHYKRFKMPRVYKIITWLALRRQYRLVRLLVRLRDNKQLWKTLSILKRI